MANPSSRPTLTTMRDAVLKTIKGLVPITLYKSVEILFKPCCDITATAQVTCGSEPDLYNFTIKFSAPLLPIRIGLIIVEQTVLDGRTYLIQGDTLTLEDVLFELGPGTYSMQVYAMFPASHIDLSSEETLFKSLTPGAYQIIPVADITVPSC